MLKRRLIPVIFLKNGLIVRSEKFAYHQNLGNPINEAKRYSDWNVDELIYIDISKNKEYDLRRNDHRIEISNDLISILRAIAKVCFMPLTFGGGIRTLEDIRLRLENGADKVTINTAAIDSPDFISQASKLFGTQCIVVSIDYKITTTGARVYKGGVEETDWNPVEWAQKVQEKGAGEIFLNSIDRDGTAAGYDIETVNSVTDHVDVPVIACGGAGTFYDFIELADKTNVSAIAAGNIFHFTELAYPRAKSALLKEDVNVRGRAE